MDDFSFPTIATDQDSFCQFPFPSITTSSLWFLSPETKTTNLRRSFSVAEGTAADISNTIKRNHRPNSPSFSDCGDTFIDYQERMDMLWEDFNEELCQASDDRKEGIVEKNSKGSAGTAQGLLNGREKHGAVELCWLPALGASKSGRVLHHKKLSLVEMLRVVKKLFVVQKTHSSKRKSQEKS
ncbi:putative Glutamate-1-semialdehyde 2,1-aminomutase 1 [Cocos nucifera]|uniref:Putative Glutamate-1-semialdehyde 2,1-aminomutase 1 n=1 Tax=Cocos nucifera TaxID=13894 RepID=A0A8K0HX24_COCNU|nr:putative Glutamate-1-semialdehyde 2,1-aminomutase 1 [Cocos nucifera]